MWDVRVANWYPNAGDDWAPWIIEVYDAILDPLNLPTMQALQAGVVPATFGMTLPLVRIWDILLWKIDRATLPVADPANPPPVPGN